MEVQMADEAKATQVTEAPVEQSAREILEDGLVDESTGKATVEPETPATEEVSTEAEEIAEAITPGEEETAPKEELSEVEKAIKEATAEDESEITPNAQKRIDKLTAELKVLRAEKEAKVAEEATKSGRVPKYSDEQLKTALKKAWEEGDANLAWDIMDHMRKQTKQELIDMYEGEKNSYVEKEKRINAEWQETVDIYAKYADTKVPEIWPNSHKDLDLKNGTSMLYQIAYALYFNKIPEKAAYYQNTPGGQKLAVADALAYLMRTKAGKQTDTKVKKLTKQLTKERMKKSPVSGVPSGEKKAPPSSEPERLEDYINERKQYQIERGV